MNVKAKLRIVLPYGHNDRVGDDFVEEDTHVLVLFCV